MPPMGVLARCYICGERNRVGCECKEGAYTAPLDPRKQSGMFVLRNQVLVRDKHACLATGRPSSNFPEPFVLQNGQDLVNHLSFITRPKVQTRITHILPLALDPFQPAKNDAHRKNKATIWAALRRHFPSLAGKFPPTSFGMVAPHNTLLLGAELSDLFMLFRYFVTPTQEACTPDPFFSNYLHD
jgi:hypothetical protein